jgi:hypothetical protein
MKNNYNPNYNNLATKIVNLQPKHFLKILQLLGCPPQNAFDPKDKNLQFQIALRAAVNTARALGYTLQEIQSIINTSITQFVYIPEKQQLFPQQFQQTIHQYTEIILQTLIIQNKKILFPNLTPINIAIQILLQTQQLFKIIPQYQNLNHNKNLKNTLNAIPNNIKITLFNDNHNDTQNDTQNDNQTDATSELNTEYTHNPIPSNPTIELIALYKLFLFDNTTIQNLFSIDKKLLLNTLKYKKITLPQNTIKNAIQQRTTILQYAQQIFFNHLTPNITFQKPKFLFHLTLTDQNTNTNNPDTPQKQNKLQIQDLLTTTNP